MMMTKAIQVYDGSGERFILPRQGRYFEVLGLANHPPQVTNIQEKCVDEDGRNLYWEIRVTDPEPGVRGIFNVIEGWLEGGHEVTGGLVSTGQQLKVDEMLQGFWIKEIDIPIEKGEPVLLCLEFLPF